MINLTLILLLTFIVFCKADTPKIKSFNFLNNTVTGDTVSVTCMLFPLTVQTTFKWLKDGTDLSLISQKENRIQILSTNSASVLFIHSIIPEDFGNYTCIASTPYGYDKFTTPLIVNVPPRWIIEPKDFLIKENEVKIIDCMASGNPMPVISWFVNQSSQDDSNSFTPITLNSMIKGFIVHQNGSLLIESSKLNFKKKVIHVQCLADNRVKEPLRKTIKIILIVPARFTNDEKFKVEKVKKGESASLRCQAIGDQPLHIQWFKDKQLLNFNSSRYDHFETKTDSGITSELLIRTTERFDMGLYTCSVKNDYSFGEKNIKLIICEVPEAPFDVKVSNIDSRSVTVSWAAPYNGNDPIESYLIYFWKSDKTFRKHNKLNEIKLNSPNTMYHLEGLKPGTLYTLNVIALNKIGYGKPSHSFYFSTHDEKPNGPPIDVRVDPKGASHVVIYWKTVPKELMNGNITGYTIKYHILRTSQEYTLSIGANYSLNYLKEYRYDLTGLKKSTTYKISIAGSNSAGQGPYCQEILVKTLDGEVPNVPKITSHTILSKSSILINWQLLDDQIILYTIYVKKKEDFLYENIISIEKHFHSNKIQGLTCNQEYLIFVSATNVYGESDFSQPLIINIHSSPLNFSFFLAQSNILLLLVIFIAIICISTILVISTLYLKRLKKKQKEIIRRMSNTSIIKNSKYIDKCDTTRSTATYATIDPIENHVTIKSAGSNTHSSSDEYETVFPKANEIRFIQINDRFSKQASKQSTRPIKKKIFDIDIYDNTSIN